MHRRLAASTAGLSLLALGALLGACSDDSPAGGSGGDKEATAIRITIDGDSVTPNAKRVEAEVGRPVTLRITADKAGELHVHSTPEQEIEFPAGASTRRLKIDKPGIVDVEDHALDQVIVQLQVS